MEKSPAPARPFGGRGAAFGCWVLVVFTVISWCARAEAHTLGLSSGQYTARGTSLFVELAFARGEIARLAPSLDADRDGHVSSVEVARGRAELERKVVGRIVVRAGDQACEGTMTDAALTEEDGFLVRMRFDCPESESRAHGFQVEVAILGHLGEGHRHVARGVSGSVVHDEVLEGDRRVMTVPFSPEGPAVGGDDEENGRSGDARVDSALGFVALGIEHIVTGYDHLAFLLALVLAPSRLRSILAMVTSFTVAHSITLALAATDAWAPSPRLVEPVIALTVVYVGVESFLLRGGEGRWKVAFLFGLAHGFGFAGALREIALPRARIGAALLSFNVGVELGQLAVLAVVVPLLVALRRRSWLEPPVVRMVSAAIAIAGGAWFVHRVAFGVAG